MLLNKINSIHSSCCHENGKRHFINTNNRPKMTGPRGWALFIDLRMLVITINSSIENIPPIHLRELTQILPTINNFSYNISKTISLDYYKGESMVRKCHNLTRKCAITDCRPTYGQRMMEILSVPFFWFTMKEGTLSDFSMPFPKPSCDTERHDPVNKSAPKCNLWRRGHRE